MQGERKKGWKQHSEERVAREKARQENRAEEKTVCHSEFIWFLPKAPEPSRLIIPGQSQPHGDPSFSSQQSTKCGCYRAHDDQLFVTLFAQEAGCRGV